MASLTFPSDVIRNDSDDEQWYEVASFSLDDVGATFQLRFTGVKGNVEPTKRTKIDDDVYVVIQNFNSQTVPTVSSSVFSDETPISEIKFAQQLVNTTTIFILVAAHTQVGMFVNTNAVEGNATVDLINKVIDDIDALHNVTQDVIVLS